VPQPPALVPGGQPLFSAAKDTYDVWARVDQRIIDPTSKPRQALARADLAESQARLRGTLFGIRYEVNDAFFTAALLQEQIGALGATIADLEARLREANARVQAGAALQADADAVESALLQERLRDDELRANRAAALGRLAKLTGHTIDERTALELPDLDQDVARARTALAELRARPEYEQFDRARDRTLQQQELASAADRPQVSAFGRVGYGKPGLNFISDRFETYALGGIQLQWKAWNWGSSERDREVLALQRSMLAADEAAFTDGLHRSIELDLASIDRLRTTLTGDDRILALRESVERNARVRLQEGAATASEYLDRSAERLRAQFDRARHHVELAQASARLLTTLGLEVR
jgi:outer membrane protein TolC